MTTYVFVNNVATTLSAPASASAISMTLAVTSGLPSSIAPGTALACTLRDATTRQVMEIVYATAISGNTLTVQRAQENTAAQNWQTGDLFFVGPTAGMMAAFLQSASGFVTAFNGRAGNVELSSTDVIDALDYTPASLVSPNFGGVPTVPTAAPTDIGQVIANTAWVNSLLSATYATIAYVNSQVAQLAPLASPAFTGTPTVPTATSDTNGSIVASTQFAQSITLGGKDAQRNDVTASRTYGTTYTNNSTRTMFISIIPNAWAGGGNSTTTLTIGDKESASWTMGEDVTNALPLFGVVMPGETYVLNYTGNSHGIRKWIEVS